MKQRNIRTWLFVTTEIICLLSLLGVFLFPVYKLNKSTAEKAGGLIYDTGMNELNKYKKYLEDPEDLSGDEDDRKDFVESFGEIVEFIKVSPAKDWKKLGFDHKPKLSGTLFNVIGLMSGCKKAAGKLSSASSDSLSEFIDDNIGIDDKSAASVIKNIKKGVKSVKTGATVIQAVIIALIVMLAALMVFALLAWLGILKKIFAVISGCLCTVFMGASCLSGFIITGFITALMKAAAKAAISYVMNIFGASKYLGKLTPSAGKYDPSSVFNTSFTIKLYRDIAGEGFYILAVLFICIIAVTILLIAAKAPESFSYAASGNETSNEFQMPFQGESGSTADFMPNGNFSPYTEQFRGNGNMPPYAGNMDQINREVPDIQGQGFAENESQAQQDYGHGSMPQEYRQAGMPRGNAGADFNGTGNDVTMSPSDGSYAGSKENTGAVTGEAGSSAGKRVIIRPDEKIFIGRDNRECRFVIQNPKVSRKHCSIRYDASLGKYEVSCFSANGILFPNGTYLRQNETKLLPKGTELIFADGAEVVILE